MKSLPWLGYSLGLFLLAGGMPKACVVLFLAAILIHWRFWIVALPLGVAAFLIGLNWR